MGENTNKIKLLVIPSDRFGGVGKFRSVGPHKYIQEHYGDEFDVEINYELPKEDLEKYLSQFDIIHLHKQLDASGNIMQLIKFLEIPVVVDVDDYFYLGNDHPMSLSAKKEKWHEPVIKHLRMADYVTTTTPIYAETLKKYNKNVAVFPNAIDPFEPQFTSEKNPSDKLRVGLICGSSHLEDIKLIGKVLPQLKENVQLVLCGFDTRGTRTIYHQDTGKVERRPIEPKESVWYDYEKILTDNYKRISPEHKEFLMKFLTVDDPFTNEPYRRMWTRDITKYGTHYQNVDVLLAPLKENDFNKHKSQLKAIEAGFTHTALIAQNFGAYTIDLTSMIGFGGKIDESANSLLVDTRKNHKDWVKYINKLADNPDMVKKLQDNLQNYITERYSLDKVCEDRVNLYRKLVKKEK